MIYGDYREKIVVPADKPYITLCGSGVTKTIVTWREGVDIFKSATISVLAPYFVGQLLTIENTYGVSAQAVALRVEGDLVAFYACNIVSYQDTLLDDVGRHYYHNCYIEGATDFICGNGASLFQRCHLHSTSEYHGSITAQHRESALDNTGFTFYGCNITSVAPAFLGRPWAAYSRVVFAITYMSDMIIPQGWDDWNRNKSERSTVYYGEYMCYGPGASTSKRVDWSKRLTHDEVVPFLNWDMLGGKSWLRPIPRKFKKPGFM
ncbi:putative pectinesterase 11 isoform X1 [Tripterygium wilfordii]|uniref:pectinesterase n=1 Tax=Tripterygium wilfordii TaxID=458696 RepID=A0A7J7DXN3_TRIWF|nr:putative pectinesterase 11 isoform X1 [Tripterygium wilfordii]